MDTRNALPPDLQPFVSALAERVSAFQPEIICGPLVEGAFIALLVASQLGCEFAYALRIPSDDDKLFPVSYRLPAALHFAVKGKRVVIVNDVISAGSAVRGAIEDVLQLSGNVVAVASVVVLGDAFVQFSRAHTLPLVALFQRNLNLWLPDKCPLCAAGSIPEHLAQS